MYIRVPSPETPEHQQVRHFGLMIVKNNTKKASTKFWKLCCIFNILCRFLYSPQNQW